MSFSIFLVYHVYTTCRKDAIFLLRASAVYCLPIPIFVSEIRLFFFPLVDDFATFSVLTHEAIVDIRIVVGIQRPRHLLLVGVGDLDRLPPSTRMFGVTNWPPVHIG